MPGTDTFYDTLAEYLTIRIGQASLGPAGTVILVLTLAAALLSASASLADRQAGGPPRPARGAARRPGRPSGSRAAPALVPAARQHRRGEPGGRHRRATAVARCSRFRRHQGAWQPFGLCREQAVQRLHIGRADLAVPRMEPMVRRIGDDPHRRAARRADGWAGAFPILFSRAWRHGDGCSLEHGLPDALDLLVICAEAGLSLDQAIEQVSEDLRASNAAVADEFATTASEMRVLSNRAEALENLVERTGVAACAVSRRRSTRRSASAPRSPSRCGSWPPKCAPRAWRASKSARPGSPFCSPSPGAVHLAVADDGDQHAGGASPRGHFEKQLWRHLTARRSPTSKQPRRMRLEASISLIN